MKSDDGAFNLKPLQTVFMSLLSAPPLRLGDARATFAVPQKPLTQQVIGADGGKAAQADPGLKAEKHHPVSKFHC